LAQLKTKGEGMARGGRKNPSAGVLPSVELVGWALGGLEREIAATRERLESLTAMATQLRGRGGARTSAVATVKSGGIAGPRSKMTAAGRKRISEMMKKRWAEAKRKKQNRLT
jgi:hypothetical protein